MVKEFLDRRRVRVEVVDATTVDSMARLASLGTLAAPVVFVGEVVVAGYDPAGLERALRDAGCWGDPADMVAPDTRPARPGDLTGAEVVWVAGFLENGLGVFDAATGLAVPAAAGQGPARIPVGAKPMGVLHDAVTGWLWVSNFEASTVTRVEAFSGNYAGGSLEAATTATAAAAADLLLDGRRRRVLVSCSSSEELTVLDADTGRLALVGSEVRVGTVPTAMVLDDDLGRIFVRAGGGVVTLDAERLGPVTGSLESSTSPPLAGRTLALDRTTKRLYAPADDRHVAVSDATHPGGAGRRPVADPVETARIPFMMLTDQPRRRVLVSCIGDRVVQAIDAGSNRVVHTTPVGRGARGLALAPDGSTLFVTCFEEDTVQVFDAATLNPRYGSLAASTFPTVKGPRGCLALAG
jgi:hypothetical protein